MVYDSKRRGEGRVDGHGVVTVSKDVSGRITVAFPYHPQLVASIRVIEDHKWRFSLLSLRVPTRKSGRSNLFDLPSEWYIRIVSVPLNWEYKRNAVVNE